MPLSMLRACKRRAGVLYVFERNMRKNGPGLWELRTPRGHVELALRPDTGIRAPHFEMLRFAWTRTDSTFPRACGHARGS